MNARLNPVRWETHEGVTVVREDLCCDDLPSGKLRGLLPWFKQLRGQGFRRVVNHAVGDSNSHAIVGYAAKACGLGAVSYTGMKSATPQTELAEKIGTRMVYGAPPRLSALAAAARKEAGAGTLILPWALGTPNHLAYIARLVGLVPVADVHVVPMGGGGYAWAVAHGLFMARYGGKVLAVPYTGDVPRNYRRLKTIAPLHGVTVVSRPAESLETPWPSDPHYEWWAWPVALELRRTVKRICFWSVGRPLC